MRGAGNLRETITIERAAMARGEGGKTVRTWAAWRPGLRAEVIPLVGNESLEAGVLQGKQVWRVTIRFLDGVTTADRVVWKGQTMQIRTAVDPDMKRQWTFMTCESGVAADG